MHKIHSLSIGLLLPLVLFEKVLDLTIDSFTREEVIVWISNVKVGLWNLEHHCAGAWLTSGLRPSRVYPLGFLVILLLLGPKQWDKLLDKQGLEALILRICLIHQAFNVLQLPLNDLKLVYLVPVLLQSLPLLRDIGRREPLILQLDRLLTLNILVVLV